MWTTFWLNNFHFALEVMMSLVFFMAGWINFDAFLIKKEAKTILRSLGFLFLVSYGIIHGTNITSDFVLLLALTIYILGSLLILVSLLMETWYPIPTLSIILIIPSIVKIAPWFYLVSSIFLLAITAVAIFRYLNQLERALKPFVLAFIFLTLASFLSIYNVGHNVVWLWSLEHLLKTVGLACLLIWVSQYLLMRMKEELLLIFVSMALFIAIFITFIFSALFLQKLENDALSNLSREVKVLDYALETMKSEAQANAALIARNEKIAQAIKNNNYSSLENLAINSLKNTNVGFLTIADSKGNTILKAHAPTAKGEHIKNEKAASLALNGNLSSFIESTPTEKLSIRGAAPIYYNKKLVGVLVGGFKIDNNLVDRIKRITELEATIYDGKTRIASTIFNPDGKTRLIGLEQTNEKINDLVLKQGQGFIGRTYVVGRPFLAAFVPIKNSDGSITGMLSVSEPQMDVLNQATKTNQLTLLVSIIIMLIAILPAYILAKKISAQV